MICCRRFYICIYLDHFGFRFYHYGLITLFSPKPFFFPLQARVRDLSNKKAILKFLLIRQTTSIHLILLIACIESHYERVFCCSTRTMTKFSSYLVIHKNSHILLGTPVTDQAVNFNYYSTTIY